MHKVKILVVEDEFIVAEDIRRSLVKSGYEVMRLTPSGEEAIAAVKMASPDLVLLDIRLGDGMDGISTAEVMRKIADIPFIYVTAHSDPATFERAKQTAPHAYIVKPFNFQNLHTAIELALYNYSNKIFAQPGDSTSLGEGSEDKPLHYYINNSIFIKSGKGFDKVRINDIQYIKADGSYSVLHTSSQSFTLSLNLHTVLERIDRPEFVRIHRTYIVNINNISHIEERGLKVGDFFVPVSRSLREMLMKKLALLR